MSLHYSECQSFSTENEYSEPRTGFAIMTAEHEQRTQKHKGKWGVMWNKFKRNLYHTTRSHLFETTSAKIQRCEAVKIVRVQPANMLN